MSTDIPKRKHIPERTRREIYNKYGGRCAYCGWPIEYGEMQIDHLIPLRNGGSDDVSNYMPACRMCNLYKGTSSVEKFRENLQSLISRLEKVNIYRLALRYCFVMDGDIWPLRFWYENWEDAKNDRTRNF